MTKEVELNVKEAVLAPIIHLMQGDSGVSIRCRILSGTDAYAVGGMFDLVVLSGVTSKGNMLSLPVKNVSGNLVEFELTQNETDVAGDIRACIEFSGSEGAKPKRLSTYPFIIKVTENPSYAAVEQKDNVKSLEDYVEQVKGYADMAWNASEAVGDARREVGELVTAARGFSETAKGYADSAGEHAEHVSVSAESAGRDAREIRGLIADAQGSAESAGTSAQTATQKADEAETSAASAAGSSENARKYEEQAKLISESFSGALRPMGTVAYENLPSLQDAVEGDMYNVSNQFSTSSSFKEGEGNVIPAGANVYKTVDGFWDVLAGSPVTAVNGQRGNVDITPENIGALSAATKYAGASSVGGDADRSKKVADSYNGGDVTFSYGNAGLDYGNYTWLAAWNGYELRAANKNQFASRDEINRINEGLSKTIKVRYPVDSYYPPGTQYTYVMSAPIGTSEIIVFSRDGNIVWFGYDSRDNKGYAYFSKIFGQATITVPANNENGGILFYLDMGYDHMAVINI